MADRVYFLPVEPVTVEKILEKERCDAILLSFGGQTALNCGVALDRSGALERLQVRVLGTPVRSILNTEDRELFIRVLDGIGVKTARSRACANERKAREAAGEIGYPLILRGGLRLGRARVRPSSGTTRNWNRCFPGPSPEFPRCWWKNTWRAGREVEYEVVRDARDNCVTVCNMENMDPLGIHTGESIVVAPSQTLTNHEYHYLRELSIRTIRELGHRGRMQHPVRALPEDQRLPRHRSQRPAEPQFGSGQQGHRLSPGLCRRQAGPGLYPGGPAKRHHPQGPRRFSSPPWITWC